MSDKNRRFKAATPDLFQPATPHRFTLAGMPAAGGGDDVRQGPLVRQLTIVQVCIDPKDGEALFVNAAGLVVPCKPGRDLLEYLRKVGEIEAHSTIVGAGRYSKKSHELDAMRKAGTLRDWVLCRVPLPAGAFFYDQQQEWANYMRRQVADAAQDAWAAGGPGDGCYWDGERASGWPPLSGDELQQSCIQRAGSVLDDLKARHKKAMAHDAEVGTWLRGEWPTPPLLKGVAA